MRYTAAVQTLKLEDAQLSSTYTWLHAFIYFKNQKWPIFSGSPKWPLRATQGQFRRTYIIFC